MIKDTTQALTTRQTNTGGGTVVLGNTAGTSDKVVEKTLDSSVNIPPVLTKNQGDHIQVIVNVDIDFSSVYKLKMRKLEQ